MSLFSELPQLVLILGAFMLWSALLLIASQTGQKLWPGLAQKVNQWPLFWLALSAIAAAPLLPVGWLSSVAVVPDILQQFDHSEQVLAMQTQQLQQAFTQQQGLQYGVGLLLAGLAVVSLYGLTGIAIAMVRIARIRRQASSLCGEHWLAQAQQTFLSHRNIEVRVTQEKVPAFVCGLINPSIILPEASLQLSKSQLSLLVEHEIQHIKQRDNASVLFMRLYTAVCWLNPFIRHLEQRFLHAMEMRCDREVLRRFPQQGQEYAQTLLLCLKQQQSTGPVARFTGHGASKHMFKQRIQQALAPEQQPRWRTRHQLLLAALSALLFLAPLNAKARWSALTTDWQNEVPHSPLATYRISSRFGVVEQLRRNRAHKGVDMVAPKGTQIHSVLSGQVTVADDRTLHKNYGKVVLITHGNGQQSLYAHLDDIEVNQGDWVSAGDVIGKLGATGRVTGPHLHFELIENGARVNPGLLLGLETKKAK